MDIFYYESSVVPNPFINDVRTGSSPALFPDRSHRILDGRAMVSHTQILHSALTKKETLHILV